jgi:hypothetical protein
MGVNRKADAGRKEPAERISILLGLLGGVITIFVSVTQQRPASTLALSAAALLLAAWFTLRMTTARYKSGRFKFPRGRRVAMICWGLVAAGIGTVMIIPSSRDFVVYDALGFPSPTRDVRIVHVLVSASADEYRTAVVVLNSTARQHLLQHVKLSTTCPGPAPAAPPEFFKVSQNFRVDALRGKRTWTAK